MRLGISRLISYMVRTVAMLAVFPIWIVGCTATPRDVVFNSGGDGPTDRNTAIHDHYDKLYRVVDFDPREHKYELPQRRGEVPLMPIAIFDGRCVRGYVELLYIIDENGRTASPHILKTPDQRLSELALARVKGMAYQPALLDGRAAAIIVDSRFAFSCPSERPVQLADIVGLWQFPERAVWVQIHNDGTAFQCRIARGEEIFVSKGRFELPDTIVWEREIWGREQIEVAPGRLTFFSKIRANDFVRVSNPMDAKCVEAESAFN